MLESYLTCCIISSVISVSVIQIIGNVFNGGTFLAAVLNSVGNPALLSLLGARLLFNMKEAGAKGLNQGTSCGSRSTVSAIGFAGDTLFSTGYLDEDETELSGQ